MMGLTIKTKVTIKATIKTMVATIKMTQRPK